jgi:hypothetical protein
MPCLNPNPNPNLNPNPNPNPNPKPESYKDCAIGLHRYQGYRICQRVQREGKTDPETGTTFYKGNAVIREKGEMYLVDCNVFGEDIGTVTEPKFVLRLLWQHVLLPAFDELVAPGGLCEHALVVHQEDNAGPHTQGGYHE